MARLNQHVDMKGTTRKGIRSARASNLRSERLQQLLLFFRDRLRERKDALVSPGLRHKREPQARVAAGGFDDRATRE